MTLSDLLRIQDSYFDLFIQLKGLWSNSDIYDINFRFYPEVSHRTGNMRSKFEIIESDILSDFLKINTSDEDLIFN